MKPTETADHFQPLNTGRSLPMALLRAREAVMTHFRPMLTAQGVTEQQWRVVRVLGEADQTDLGTLADRAAILPPSLSRILAELERRGLVTRSRDAADARVWLAKLTAKGHDLIGSVQPNSEEIYARIEAELGADKLEDLLDLLNAATDALTPKA